MGMARGMLCFAYAAGIEYGIERLINKELTYGALFQ